jgi:hypothetical protein
MTTSGRQTARRRGAVIVEFVMAIPLLALIIALTYFFGWAMMHQQQVWIADRYAAWRAVRGGGGAGGGHLNATFFRDEAANVSVSGGSGPAETLQDYVFAVGSYSAEGERLADATVLGRWPRGRSASVGARFAPIPEGFRHLTGPIRSAHVREGVAWRRGQARLEHDLVDVYLGDLDGLLGALPAPAEKLAETFRGMYLHGW